MADMKRWEFYNELNEIVYVVDIDSYEVVYMNRRAREAYGVEKDDFQGRKCYELLSGGAYPCASCHSKKLRSGYFREEVCYNPVIRRRISLKETIVEEEGKKYRFVLAVDMGASEQQEGMRKDSEAMINEGLRISLSAPTPELSVNALLEYLGQSLSSERVYIFEEMSDGTFSNTYEWCARDVVPQKENLQQVPFKTVSMWYQKFQQGKSVIIKNLEDVREKDADIYECLKPQNIHSLIVSPLVDEKEIIGFYGVDNPPEKYLDHINTLFQIWGHFFISLLRRRNLVRRLEEMCFQDQLTGIGNRHAMHEYVNKMDEGKSIGIVYCDVMGLKKANDTKGHQAGDQLLMRACGCLKRIFGDYALFRVGGDEFLVLCAGMDKAELLKRAEKLRSDMKEADAVMAIGCVWRPDGKEDMDQLIKQADERMYEEKRELHAKEEKTFQGGKKTGQG